MSEKNDRRNQSHHRRHFLIRHRELAIIPVPVGEGEGDDVVARVGDVELDAVGRRGRGAVNQGPCGRGDRYVDQTEVLGEGHREVVAINGSLDGGAARSSMHIGFINLNMAVAIRQVGASGIAPCCWKDESEQQKK